MTFHYSKYPKRSKATIFIKEVHVKITIQILMVYEVFIIPVPTCKTNPTQITNNLSYNLNKVMINANPTKNTFFDVYQNTSKSAQSQNLKI
jgi:hypothetical protein